MQLQITMCLASGPGRPDFASDPHWALPLDPTVPAGDFCPSDPVPTMLFNSGNAAGALHQTPLEELRTLPQTASWFQFRGHFTAIGVARISVWGVGAQVKHQSCQLVRYECSQENAVSRIP